MDVSEIKRKAEQFHVSDEEEDLPDVIYHYCPFSAFVGIIESAELWLSHHNSMNDLSEARWFYTLLVDEANKVADDKNREKLSSFLRNYELNLKDYFILSFSLEPDVLSQWTMYADDGRGVAIGFHTGTFRMRRRVPHYSIGSGTNRGIFRVEYSEKTARQRARDLVELVTVGVWGDVPPSVERLALATKHVGFSNEKEVRIVEVQDFRTNMNPDFPAARMRHPGSAYRYRVRNGDDLVVYRAHGYRSAEDDFHLHSLWFGPQADIDHRALTGFLDSNRIILDAGVHRSDIPYFRSRC